MDAEFLAGFSSVAVNVGLVIKILIDAREAKNSAALDSDKAKSEQVNQNDEIRRKLIDDCMRSVETLEKRIDRLEGKLTERDNRIDLLEDLNDDLEKTIRKIRRTVADDPNLDSGIFSVKNEE